MSNRRRPRFRHTGLHELRFADDLAAALDYIAGYRCPDCNSELTEPVVHGQHLASVDVRHDPSCPWVAGWTR